MSAKLQESKPENEIQDMEQSLQFSYEPTKEIYRREGSQELDASVCSMSVKSSKTSPRAKTPDRKRLASKNPAPKEIATRKTSNSGIPLRLRSGTNASAKGQTKSGTYRSHTPSSSAPINKNTLEVQFMNNKKRLIQLHSELVEKQRPLIDMHKSLLRTKKQLEELGKKVVLEDMKVVSLKVDTTSIVPDDQGAGEQAAEAVLSLKTSIDSVFETCAQVCQKCFVQNDEVVKILENVSKTDNDSVELEMEVAELHRKKSELEKSLAMTLSENESRISELINQWQKSVRVNTASEEMKTKVAELEDKVKLQHKSITDAEENAHSLNRKFEDKKANYEKSIVEFQDKINKLEEDLKKEKKTTTENLMKSRNLRNKLTELEAKTKETEDKSNETNNKLKQLQEQLRKKEIQWLKEKDDFKKNEAVLQQKFIEKQSQFDTRLKDLEDVQRMHEKEKEGIYRSMETQLEMKEHELFTLEEDRELLNTKTKEMENLIEKMQKELENKEKEIDTLSARQESLPAIEYTHVENQWREVMDYQRKIVEVQTTLKEQTDQIQKMQNSLKAHAQLAVALKLEKDNAMKYSNKLRDILQEARDEIEFKNKTIYKIHEKLVLKEAACDKLKAELKEYEATTEYSPRKYPKNRCQICMSDLHDRPDCGSCAMDSEVGKSNTLTHQYVSDSLIGMSVKKVNNLRNRLDNLKKMALADNSEVASHSGSNSNLRRQIEMRGKLYQVLQKHADQSCEDFINLLKLTVSTSGKSSQGLAELKPSNINFRIDEAVNCSPKRYSSNIKITKSINTMSQYVKSLPSNQAYHQHMNESVILENDDDNMSYY